MYVQELHKDMTSFQTDIRQFRLICHKKKGLEVWEFKDREEDNSQKDAKNECLVNKYFPQCADKFLDVKHHLWY